MPCCTATRDVSDSENPHDRQPVPAALKLHSAPRSAANTVTAYDTDHVAVNGQKFSRSLLLTPDQLDATWGPSSSAALTVAHLAPLATLPCDVLLLGTGRRQQFPPVALLRPLIEAGRNIEVMDTPAACRTYNILMAEGRSVAAALIIETTT